MIGQDFFDLRSRIGTALYSLAQLATEAGVEAGHAKMLENLVGTLKDPFVFVVVGEVNVGKSTFLNALFAAEITKTGVVPTTDKILFFKYGQNFRRLPVSRTLEEIHAPVDCLRDFHIVDTPGTNSIENEHQEITERFVPMADLVIFVFSAMNPWGASAWQFLEKVHRQWMRNVIFVLQQCDIRTDEEVAAILDYMRQLCRQRFQREFPIFPVSAKKAYLARSGGLDRDRLLGESGYPPLESHISRAIGASGQRLAKLSTAVSAAGGVLKAITERGAGRAAVREERSTALREIERELGQAEEHTNGKLVSAIEAAEADFGRGAGEVLARVRERLTTGAALGSAFREKRSFAGAENALMEKLQAGSGTRWAGAAVVIEDDVCAAADRLSERVMKDLKVQLRDELRPERPFWEAQRQHFAARVEESIRGCVQRLQLDRLLQPALAQTRKIARNMVLLVLASLIGAGVLAAQGQWLVGGAALAAGGVIATVLGFSCGAALRRARWSAEAATTAAGPDLRAQLTIMIRDEVRSLYDSFSRILQPTRDKLTEQQTRHTSLQSQVHAMELVFQALEGELGALLGVSSRNER
jgi:GTP-binding protein EngB required for normal cell division